MSGTTNVGGVVLGAATAMGGAAVLPNTGNSTLGLILPIAAIVCGVAIVASIMVTNWLSKRNSAI